MSDPSGSRNAVSTADALFRQRFEACDVPLSEFDHLGHLRLAYTYLCEADVPVAHACMKEALRRYIAFNDVDPAKFHETLTYAWMLAVRLFMRRAGTTADFEAFMASAEPLRDPAVMMTHYSDEYLFSDQARQKIVPPDRDPIPGFAA